jgi:hypothetical protein
MNRICLYFRAEPERDRWLPGDRFVRPLVRRVVRGKPRIGGVERVFVNLRLGLDRLEIPYLVNLPFRQLRESDLVGVVGRGQHCLDGYDRPNPIVAGPYTMTHPSEWPTLCDDYPVVKYLQHCKWANDIYIPWFGERRTIWPHGVDTTGWAPSPVKKDLDILLYDKVRWERQDYEPNLIQPIRDILQRHKLKFAEIRYGFYTEEEYRGLLARSRAMVFLVEHESQGSACQECLSCDVPILAWNQGWFKDPNRFKWGEPNVPAGSVPYFDDRCGEKFEGIGSFETQLERFWQRLQRGELRPRDFVLENLTVEQCSQDYIDILTESTGAKGIRRPDRGNLG